MKQTLKYFTTSHNDFFILCDKSYLLEEGRNGAPKMMTVGLHCRLVGRPGRAAGLAEFIDYAKSQPDIWIARRDEIAKHWYEHHYPSES